MRVIHINLYDKHGGAAMIAWTLMNEMTEMGHDTAIFAHRKMSQDSRVIPIPFIQTAWQKNLLEQQGEQGLFDLYSAALLRVLNHPLFQQADIVHLHCINGNYFSFLLLPFLASKPLVWTLHDSLAFTANCLFTDSCDGWKDGRCASCPQDGETKNGLQREFIQQIKKIMYKISNFTTVCPSAWLTQQAKESILQEKDIRLIYNGIDSEIFKPGDKVELRLKLGLPTNKKIILFAAHGGLNNSYKGGNFLCQALLELYKEHPDIILLTIGAYSVSVIDDFPVLHIDIPFIDNQQHLAEYYAAVDLYVSPTLTEVFGLTVCEAMASGVPVVAFAVGGIPELVIHKENGYLVERGNVGELVHGMSYFLGNEEIRQRAGKAARLRVIEKFCNKRMVADYIQLYEEILNKKQQITGESVDRTPSQEEITRVIESHKSKGWNFVWEWFHHRYSNFSKEQGREKTTFVDQFCTYCLKVICSSSESNVLWEVIAQWQSCRPVPGNVNNLRLVEIEVFYNFIKILRKSLTTYFKKGPKDSFIILEEEQQQRLYTLWQQVFLNDFLALPMEMDEQLPLQEESAFKDMSFSASLQELLLISMYRPTDAEQFNVNVIQLWQEKNIPEYYKVLITFWLLHVPYYNLEEKHRQKILKYAGELFSFKIPTSAFIPLVNECTRTFWRISYVGGNNLPALANFGDFIVAHMKYYIPQQIKAHSNYRRASRKKKLRIGYISRLFYGQAVSYYMVNRVIHHDQDKFEVYTFALGKAYDEITGLFEKHSDCFKQFGNIDRIQDVYSVIQEIIDCKLDILIYTDIGMDPLTYMLAGLRLAPIQCVLVGHGTTSGLPTIDYYISGDFEPSDASLHYREKLVRLPNLGAAQFSPPFEENIPITRKDWKIPEDAVVFVSCANGIKHGPTRDSILIEILKQVPKACILLKPYHAANLDQRLDKRIMAVAQKAGVESRLFIVPPLGRVDALLYIADIQLDTYPYGGWTTTLEALYMGLPLVTQEGDMARNRWGAHMLRALGIKEGIAANEKEYVEWAVELAENKELRGQIKDKINRQVKSTLFNGAVAQSFYERALVKIFEGKNSMQ
jgi:glycosyltransferase involved in cell wall biosynthesis